MPGRRRWWTGRRLEVGGPLQYAASIYLGLSLLGRMHGVVWHALGFALLLWGLPLFAVSVWRFARYRPAPPGDYPLDRPVVGIEPRDRGEWLYAPGPGRTEIELLLRGHRYAAVFDPSEAQAYRTVIAGITAALNGGTRRVDVNAAFAEALGREPFTARGPIPPTLSERLFGLTRARPAPRRGSIRR